MKKLTFTIIFSVFGLLLATRIAALPPASTSPATSSRIPTEKATPSGTATLSGTVRTPLGVAVPGAAVHLLNVASGEAWETSTDVDGTFSVPGLPRGHYRIEAHQLGLGTALWDDEIAPSSPEKSSTKINLTLRPGTSIGGAPEVSPAPAADLASRDIERANAETASNRSVKNQPQESGTPVGAPPKRHHVHKADVAGQTTNAGSASSANSESSIAQSSNLDLSASGTKKRGKSKKSGFEPVETSALAANADVNQEVTPSTPPVNSANTQSVSTESYLISGAVGRGSTAVATDANGQDDSIGVADVNASNKPGKHHSHSGSGHSGSKKAFAQAIPSDNLAGGVADLAVQDKIKHMGSNQMHLTLYNYYDSSVLDARNYSLTGAPIPAIAHFSERFGTNLGGPLTIPKLYNGKDRTFWFVNYELNRLTNADDLFKTVPTVSERSGNFCDRGVQLFDPLTGLDGPRQPFGCTIPASRFDPTAVKVMSLISEPNLPGLILNYHRGIRVPTSMDIVNFRLLHSISSRFSVLGSYNLVSARGKTLTSFPSLDGTAAARAQNITLGFTQNWTPRLINETKINFNRNRNQIFSTNAFTNNVAAQYGFTGVSTAPIDYGVPLVTYANFAELADPAALLVRNQTLRLFDNISYTLRRHNVRTGAEIRRRQLNTYTDPTARGVYSFSGLMTSQLDAKGTSNAATGLDFADFLLGLPETTNVQYGTNSNYGRSWQFISYAQDDWRVTPRFSVNYGVRYELYTPFVEKDNHLANLLINPSVSQAAVVVPGQTDPFGGALPNSLIRPRRKDFAPRVGIAWRPFKEGGPVVRAGYGIFYNGSIYDDLYSEMLNQPPWALSRTLVTSATQLLTLENGFPPSPPDAVTNVYGADPNYKVGYAQIWNFSIEQRFGRNYVVELLYTGTKGTHLDLLEDPNQAAPGSVIGSDQRRRIPNVSGFNYETSGGNSIYNGVQVRMQKRMSDGLRFQFLYTLGHSIDDASVIGVGHVTGLVQDYYNLRAERGNSFFDIRNDVRTWFFYDLPFGARRTWLRSGLGAKLLGNWQLSANTLLNSGSHLTPYITAQNTNGVGPLFSQRPDQIGNPNLPDNQRTNNHFFDVSAFSLPQAGNFGNAARGTIVGPGLFNVNASFGRRMHFGKDDRFQFELRWEVQNLTNSANLTNVVTVVDADDAGVATGVKSMRSMDILLRLRF